MNMQALMKQAQAMQKDMLKAKEEIDNTIVVEENEMIKITVKGTKEVVSMEIKNKESFEVDDLEMLEDLIIVALNKANTQIDKLSESKMGKYSSAMPGLF